MGSLTTGSCGGGQRIIHGFPVHPAAEVYPLITGTQLEEFCQSVRKKMTVYEPVVFHDGQILDGRNRLLAVERIKKETGREPDWKREEIDASSGELLADFVERKNKHRRQMTQDQEAASAVKLHGVRETELSERRQKASRFGSDPGGLVATPEIGSPSEVPKTRQTGKRNPTTAARIAAKAGVKKHRVEKALKVQKEQGDDGLNKVLNGEVMLSTAVGSTMKEVEVLAIPEQVAKHWKSMKRKFAIEDLPEVRRELRTLLKVESESYGDPAAKIKVVEKTPAPPFNGMGFVMGGTV